MRAIGIKFDSKTEPLYLQDEGSKIGIEGGLSSRETDAIDPILKRKETVQEGPPGKSRELFGRKNKGMVMAVKAAEVTVREEEDGTDLSRPIDKRSL